MIRPAHLVHPALCCHISLLAASAVATYLLEILWCRGAHACAERHHVAGLLEGSFAALQNQGLSGSGLLLVLSTCSQAEHVLLDPLTRDTHSTAHALRGMRDSHFPFSARSPILVISLSFPTISKYHHVCLNHFDDDWRTLPLQTPIFSLRYPLRRDLYILHCPITPQHPLSLCWPSSPDALSGS